MSTMDTDPDMGTEAGKRSVGQIIDDGPWSGYQKLILFLVALTIVFDGFDAQVIGFSIPALSAEWGIDRAAFAPVVASGVFGMMIGSTVIGPIVDQIGRRATIIGAVLVYGAATLAAAAAPDMTTLAILRFVAGAGIGAALPAATTIAAEFTPARYRTIAIVAAIVCVPLGGLLAGLTSQAMLPGFGWRSLFVIGGALPLALAFFLMRSLPESPSWLSLKPHRSGELVQLMRRMGHDIVPGALARQQADVLPGVTEAAAKIFGGALIRRTMALWVMCFLSMLTIYSSFNWLPALLTASSMESRDAGYMLTAYNFGGVAGSLLSALAITRFGSRPTLTPVAFLASFTAYAATTFDPAAQAYELAILFAINGACVNGLQAAIYALCAHSYATNIRGFGTALTLAVGRIGAIGSALVGIAFVSAGRFEAFMIFSACAMLGVATMLMFLDSHIPPADKAAVQR
ncbi:MFS transporter [Sphingopyxis macrogoltabida]|uniref:Major facilitator superfamily (MFS) profile domain-containing protein n=1 Tax=Sphingopyxis macrogoltabida TaxID=33050 RepID=A0AAC9AWI9_SPHMC|nr:MFS transporter [Sphingopyxis macrogoltabida]ALJ14728.1 hypothetical protein LH19_17810 [Sphingopyxis macrogoltabida]AMU90984.1 hypothetical protein ATM17_18375 [Sphingopyxis macrogoltabida]